MYRNGGDVIEVGGLVGGSSNCGSCGDGGSYFDGYAGADGTNSW